MANSNDEPREPTAQDAAEIGAATSEAVQNAPPEQRRQVAKDTIETEGKKRGIVLPEEEVDKVANRVVDMLEVRGAFDPPPAQEPQQPPQPDEPAQPVEPVVPRKKTVAERFFGE